MVAMEAVWAIGDLLQHQLRQSNKRRIDVQQEVIELQNQQCEHLKTLLDAMKVVVESEPRLIAIPGATLDRYEHTLTLQGGMIVELTTPEFRLVDMLLRSAPKPVPYDLLRERIWNMRTGAILTNRLEVLVSQVRKKVGDSFIENVRNYGYRASEVKQ
jgi:DNA-binding winged helix-turn-helix (wHTH) protein